MARTRANRGSNVDRQHKFSQIPSANIPRSVFNRSCGLKTTFDSGYLIPIFLDEALPGDTMNLKVSTFARMATPIVPLMDNLHLDLFFFFVPLRLMWTNFPKFMGEQTDPGDSVDFTAPLQSAPPTVGWITGSLGDYFGIPIDLADFVTNAFPFRAYNLIWNEWFRDENLQDSAVVNMLDSGEDPANYPLRRRGKRHDYFTSCLPFPQKGTAVELPLGTTAPITMTGDRIPQWEADDDTTARAFFVSNTDDIRLETPTATNLAEMRWNDPKLEVDLSTATAATINDIRQAFQLQKLYERDARGGTRYTEIVRSHFGVTSPDARLQRPEYLGGGHVPINVSAVPQTSETDANTPQGNLAAFATSSGTSKGFVKSFTEHGIILGLANVRADLNYQQGLNRMMSRSTRFDYYWPSFAHLGEQAVLNKEIFAVGFSGPGTDELVFGYQERYAEYRYKPSLITGQFRSEFAQSLDIWHLAQDFAALPVLDDTFIQDTPPVGRVIATPSEPEFLFDAFFDYRCVRPMPVYGVPGLVDHF